MQPLIPAQIILEPHGFLELQKACAEDLDVVNAARVSFAKYSEEVGAQERGLIKFLLANSHTSPFEHTFFKFRVRAPIAVAREWVRHRIGIAWNEESGRYVQLRPDFYLPQDQHVRSQVGKPGSYRFESLPDPASVTKGKQDMVEAYKVSFQLYQDIQSYGWAKELARFVLPVGLYTEWIWSCNAHSLMHFVTLRNSTDAQLEIRLYAAKMLEMFQQIMPVTAKWFQEVGG